MVGQEQKGGQWARRTVRKGTKRTFRGGSVAAADSAGLESHVREFTLPTWEAIGKGWTSGGVLWRIPCLLYGRRITEGLREAGRLTEKASVIIPGASDITELCSVSLYLWGYRFSTKKNTEIHLFSLIHYQGIIVHLEDNLWIASSEGWILTLFPLPLILCYKCFLREGSYLHFLAYPDYHKKERKKKYKKFVKSSFCSVAWFFW